MEFFFYNGDVSRNEYVVANSESIVYTCRYERKQSAKYLYDRGNHLIASCKFNVTKT